MGDGVFARRLRRASEKYVLKTSNISGGHGNARKVASNGEEFLMVLFKKWCARHNNYNGPGPGRIRAAAKASVDALKLLYRGYEVKMWCYPEEGVMLLWYDGGAMKSRRYSMLENGAPTKQEYAQLMEHRRCGGGWPDVPEL